MLIACHVAFCSDDDDDAYFLCKRGKMSDGSKRLKMNVLCVNISTKRRPRSCCL